jgi:hypothetical protein
MDRSLSSFCPTGGIDLAKAPNYLALPNVVRRRFVGGAEGCDCGEGLGANPQAGRRGGSVAEGLSLTAVVDRMRHWQAETGKRKGAHERPFFMLQLDNLSAQPSYLRSAEFSSF